MVVVGSAPVVVGTVVVGSMLVVVASAVVVVGAVVVGGAVVVVVVGSVTGGWVLVAPKVENASVLVVAPAATDAWALAGPAVVVGLLRVGGMVSGVVVDGVGAVVGARGLVVGSTRTSLPARPVRSAAPGRVPGVAVKGKAAA